MPSGIPELITSAFQSLLDVFGPEETLVLLVFFIALTLIINTVIFLIKHLFTTNQRKKEKEENRRYEREQREQALSDEKIKEASKEFAGHLTIVYNHLTECYKQFPNEKDFSHYEQFLSAAKCALLVVNQYFNSNQTSLNRYTDQYTTLIKAWENHIVVCAKKLSGADFSIVTAIHGIDLNPPPLPPDMSTIVKKRLRAIDGRSPYILPIIIICFFCLIVLSIFNPYFVTIFSCTLLILLFILLFVLIFLIAKAGSITEILKTLLPLFSEDTRMALANSIYDQKVELLPDANEEAIANMKSALNTFEEALVNILQNANDHS